MQHNVTMHFRKLYIYKLIYVKRVLNKMNLKNLKYIIYFKEGKEGKNGKHICVGR